MYDFPPSHSFRGNKPKTPKNFKTPYHITITNTLKYFNVGAPSLIMKEIEVINKNENFEPLITWGSNQEEIKKEVDLINDKKYNRIWNGLGGVFKTEHNTQFNDYKYFLGGVSIPTIYILFETRFQATTPPKKTKPKNKLDLPMKAAKPFKPCFLNHFNNFDVCSYVDNNGECVLKTIYDVLNRKEKKFSLKFLTEKINQASLELYDRKYKKKHGITSNILLNVCKKLNISLLGYDENNKSFVRFTPDRTKHKGYKAIVYQMALGHFYIITDTNIINSLTASLSDTFFKNLSIENTEEEKQKVFYYIVDDITKWLENPENDFFNIYDIKAFNFKEDDDEEPKKKLEEDQQII